jgi:two-component system response regulator AtoC
MPGTSEYFPDPDLRPLICFMVVNPGGRLKTKILLIEDDESFFEAVELMLSDHPIEIVWAATGANGIQAYQRSPHSFGVVIIDYLLPDLRGTEVCQHLRKTNADQAFLFASGHFETEYLTDQLETGACGFLKKGNPVGELRSQILKVLSDYETKRRVVGLDVYEPSKAELDLKKEGFIGRSEVMHSILSQIVAARNSPYPTLIIGETGTGKELVAKALTPPGKKLVAVNCASFIERENLLETELFGYVKGAFTGADKDTIGLVTQAHNGVLFLDELHQLSMAAQAKLLRFLQEMKFRRVGDNGAQEAPIKFKLIAAVQPDIKERLNDKRFQPDLIERVGALVIRVPALRDRTCDIEPLVRHFQDEFNRDLPASKKKQIRISTINEMMKHPWPTNVRGLQNAVKQMLTNCDEDIVNPKHFKAYLERDLLTVSTTAEVVSGSLEDATRVFESDMIKGVLLKCKTQTEAAIRLGVPLSSFVRKLAKLEINPESFLKQI